MRLPNWNCCGWSGEVSAVEPRHWINAEGTVATLLHHCIHHLRSPLSRYCSSPIREAQVPGSWCWSSLKLGLYLMGKVTKQIQSAFNPVLAFWLLNVYNNDLLNNHSCCFPHQSSVHHAPVHSKSQSLVYFWHQEILFYINQVFLNIRLFLNTLKNKINLILQFRHQKNKTKKKLHYLKYLQFLAY